jgi:hypothetical protein
MIYLVCLFALFVSIVILCRIKLFLDELWRDKDTKHIKRLLYIWCRISYYMSSVVVLLGGLAAISALLLVMDYLIVRFLWLSF